MNSFEVNKIVGAILVTVLIFIVVSMIGNALVPLSGEDAHVERAATESGSDAASPSSRPSPSTPEPSAPESVSALLAGADIAAGEKLIKKCAACHSIDQGGANKVGPNLWNVVGAPKAGHDGFSYSSALTALGGAWTYEDLNHFLAKPKAFAPGTKMGFAGLKDADDRANLIAFLRTLSASPQPLP